MDNPDKLLHPKPALDVMQRSAAEAEAMLKLLANRHRLLILCALVKGPRSAGELTNMSGLSQSALSQHLAKLRDDHMVRSEKRGQLVFYHLSDPRVEALLATLYLMYCAP